VTDRIIFLILGIWIYYQERMCKFSSRGSFGMNGIHCFQDLFPTSKLVHSSVIVFGHEFLRTFNGLTMEKIIFLYSYSFLNKLFYSIFKMCIVMFFLRCESVYGNFIVITFDFLVTFLLSFTFMTLLTPRSVELNICLIFHFFLCSSFDRRKIYYWSPNWQNL